MTPNAGLILSTYDDVDSWQHLRIEAATMAQRTDRKDPIPREMRIDWVSFPRRRHGRG